MGRSNFKAKIHPANGQFFVKKNNIFFFAYLTGNQIRFRPNVFGDSILFHHYLVQMDTLTAKRAYSVKTSKVLYLKILERSASSQLLQGVTTCKHSLLLVNRLHVKFQFTCIWKSYFTDVTCSVDLDMLLFFHLRIKFHVTSFTFFMHCNDMLLKTPFVEQDLSTLYTFRPFKPLMFFLVMKSQVIIIRRFIVTLIAVVPNYLMFMLCMVS